MRPAGRFPVDRHPAGTPQLSVVIPVRDEADSLGPLWDALGPELEAAGEAFEVIFVDDASTDGSDERLAELAGRDPRIRILRLDRHWGQSAAIAAGMRASRGAWILTLDADLQNDPRDIPALLALRDRADLVAGVRRRRRDPWGRRVASLIGNRVRDRLTGDRVSDTGCSLKLFRAELARELPAFRGMHRFLPTLIRMQGGRVVEIPVRHHPRRAGVSKYGILNRLWSGLADCLAVRWMRSRYLDYRTEERTQEHATRENDG